MALTFYIALLIVLAPLFGAITAGLFGQQIGREWSHRVTILGVAVSFLLSLKLYMGIVWGFGDVPVINENVYLWLNSAGVDFNIGFLIDELSTTMMVVVTFVSLMVHIYTIGYMDEDPGYQRFFSYISLFTFSMLMLVMSNNFLQLFFGWEAVGLVSYLLIGFWFKKDTAIFANLKAFLVNRVGDFGFLLGIAAILMFFDTLDYAAVFQQAPAMADKTVQIWGSSEWSLLTVICILLFIGAMGKSAQAPLHVWLPDSMEGPTPISALIHAATMVTAGIFMVARMSPLFELSEAALSFVMMVGAFTAFFMGLLGLVQNDIKRVVAYSTLSQLGYMTVALGVSAYAAGIFHLTTHAFFKALLFLAAGSVIVGMHHEQDMRKMGGLYRYMPITWITCLIGSLALIGFPGFAGFFSKDAIIEAVHHSDRYGSQIAYWAVLLGVFITALYSFRLVFMVFHGEERMSVHAKANIHESPGVITVPLILLAIPSVVAGIVLIQPMLFGDYFGNSILVAEGNNSLEEMGRNFHGWLAMLEHGFTQLPFIFASAGVVCAFIGYIVFPDLPAVFARLFSPIHRMLINKYGFDEFNQMIFAKGSRAMGSYFSNLGDRLLIDGVLVNGSARAVGFFSGIIRHIQSGFLFHYAFAMILGLLLLMFVFVGIATDVL